MSQYSLLSAPAADHVFQVPCSQYWTILVPKLNSQTQIFTSAGLSGSERGGYITELNQLKPTDQILGFSDTTLLLITSEENIAIDA